MPKATFYNLPAPKQQKIIAAGLQEFAAVPYSMAKVANIVKAADIPRGSFYQYFEDLLDLYGHLWDLAIQNKLQYMQKNADPTRMSGDVFEQIRYLYRVGLQFVMDNPQWGNLAIQFYREDYAFRAAFEAELEKQGLGFFRTLLRQAQANGEVRSDVSIEMAAATLYQMNRALAEDYLRQHKSYTSQESHARFLGNVDAVVDLLQNGLERSET